MAEKDDVVSPQGMKCVASVGGESQPDPDILSEALHDEVRTIPASEEMHDFPCGPRGPKLYHLDVYGKVVHNNGNVPDKCGQCCVEWFRSITCRCALCGLVILPGDAVALYRPSRKFKKERVTEVKSGVLGCMRWDCCESGAFFAGHWTGEGFKSAFGDGMTAVEKCFATGQVVVSDMSEMSDAAAEIEKPLAREFALSTRPPWYRRLLKKMFGA